MHRKNFDGACVSADSFLMENKKAIEKEFLILRRIPNITLELLIRVIDKKYPQRIAYERNLNNIGNISVDSEILGRRTRMDLTGTQADLKVGMHQLNYKKQERFILPR